MLIHFVRTRFIVIVFLLICTTIPEEVSGLFWYSPPIEFVPSPGGRLFDLSVDPLGNAFTAYTDNSGNVAVARFSDSNEAYEPPFTLATGGDMNSVAVATGVSGTAVCVWQNGTLGTLDSAYYNGSIWTIIPTPVFSGTPTVVSFNPDLQMNSSGDALLTWSYPTFTEFVYVSFFNGGTQTWTTPFIIGAASITGLNPKVAFNNAGDGIVIWREITGELYSSYYNSSLLFWNGPTLISTNVTLNSYSVGIDSAGNSIAVWQNLINNLVFSTYYNKALDQFFPQALTAANGGVPSMGMTPSGNAFVAWENGGLGFYNEYRIATSSWTGVATMPLVMGSENLKVGIDSAGNALIIYSDSGDLNTMSVYKAFNGPFQSPSIAVANPNQIERAMTGLADTGRGFVDGAYNSNLGILGTFTTNEISGSACFDPNGDRVRFLSWAPFRDPDIVAYYLKRNSTLIAVNLATQPRLYVDKDRNADITDVYTVIAVDASGNELSRRRIALR